MNLRETIKSALTDLAFGPGSRLSTNGSGWSHQEDDGKPAVTADQDYLLYMPEEVDEEDYFCEPYKYDCKYLPASRFQEKYGKEKP